jgi:hypothetical protein
MADQEEEELYIISMKRTHKVDLYITFWRPNSNGYTHRIKPQAGIYKESELIKDYHNTETNTTVPKKKVDKMVLFGPDGSTVLLNTITNWEELGLLKEYNDLA